MLGGPKIDPEGVQIVCGGSKLTCRGSKASLPGSKRSRKVSKVLLGALSEAKMKMMTALWRPKGAPKTQQVPKHLQKGSKRFPKELSGPFWRAHVEKVRNPLIVLSLSVKHACENGNIETRVACADPRKTLVFPKFFQYFHCVAYMQKHVQVHHKIPFKVSQTPSESINN